MCRFRTIKASDLSMAQALLQFLQCLLFFLAQDSILALRNIEKNPLLSERNIQQHKFNIQQHKLPADLQPLRSTLSRERQEAEKTLPWWCWLFSRKINIRKRV